MSEATSRLTAPQPAGAVSGWIAARADILLTLAIAAALVLKFALVFRLNVNWDEFFYLSFVQDYLRGTVSDRFQTFHVHLFAWLPAAVSSEIGQIIAARLVMAGCATVSALLLYGIARRFLSREAALFGLLAYLSNSAVIEHGASFRTDTLATLLVLLALFLTLRRPGGLRGIALAGLVFALAVLITIKTAFYGVLMAPLVWCLGRSFRDRAALALTFAVCFGLAFAALYGLHVAGLAPPDTDTGSYLQGTAAKVFLEDGLMPRWAELVTNLAKNLPFWLLMVYGTAQAWRQARQKGRGWEAWLPLLLALPILTPIFYRNAFAYYYAFILPPAAILIGLVYDRLARQDAEAKEPRAALRLAVLIGLPVGFLLFHAAANWREDIDAQRRTLDAVHAVFPQPVPYIDGYAVVSSFPRSGFFMSSWGVDKYRAAGTPVYPALVAQMQPPLLLADSPSLYAALFPGVEVKPQRQLLPADVAFLRENYLPHWGMIFVAGKTLELPPAGEERRFEIAVAGEYRLETRAAVTIDGETRGNGDIVTLAAGSHDVMGDPAAGPVTLRWAQARPGPDAKPTDIWTFFDVGD
jgi:hypothetical protein